MIPFIKHKLGHVLWISQMGPFLVTLGMQGNTASHASVDCSAFAVMLRANNATRTLSYSAISTICWRKRSETVRHGCANHSRRLGADEG